MKKNSLNSSRQGHSLILFNLVASPSLISFLRDTSGRRQEGRTSLFASSPNCYQHRARYAKSSWNGGKSHERFKIKLTQPWLVHHSHLSTHLAIDNKGPIDRVGPILSRSQRCCCCGNDLPLVLLGLREFHLLAPFSPFSLIASRFLFLVFGFGRRWTKFGGNTHHRLKHLILDLTMTRSGSPMFSSRNDNH